MRGEKSPQQLYEEREKRIRDAIQLKMPDRVPVLLGAGYFVAKYAGITCEEAYYDPDKWRRASRKTVLDFEPDFYRAVIGTTSGLALEALDTKHMKWPGHGVPPGSCHQFVEGEYMKENEYDALLSDPSDFVIRTYLPRVFGTMAPFEKFPSFKALFGTSAAILISQLATPDFAGAFSSLRKAADEALKWRSAMSSFDDEMADLGFPCHARVMSSAPFDVISDYLRGMRGAMIDMYRRPEKLIQACEKLLPVQIEIASAAAKGRNSRRVFIPLHRGSDGFMSLKQFKTFY